MIARSWREAGCGWSCCFKCEVAAWRTVAVRSFAGAAEAVTAVSVVVVAITIIVIATRWWRVSIGVSIVAIARRMVRIAHRFCFCRSSPALERVEGATVCAHARAHASSKQSGGSSDAIAGREGVAAVYALDVQVAKSEKKSRRILSSSSSGEIRQVRLGRPLWSCSPHSSDPSLFTSFLPLVHAS